MPCSPLAWLAKMPDRLLPMPVERNQPPMPRPTRRVGASLVVIDRPIGDRQSSPMDWIQYTANRVQNGILLMLVSTRKVKAYHSRPKARPLNRMPRPNLRGIDGFMFLRPMATQIQAISGAQAMMATEFTLWNQAVGNSVMPSAPWR